ncbi:MAG: rRNA maturation RNase YbeY [Nitrospirales bacterium]|nr:rRNA maturation RNase YbeY [Nitrospirales bacterium]
MPVLLQNRQRAVAVNCAWLGRTAEAVLAAAHVESAELSLVLVSDRRMRTLNQRYRKKDRTTDVLAFPMHEIWPSKRRSPAPAASLGPRTRPGASGAGGCDIAKSRLSRVPMVLGDVVISMPTAKRQAAELGHSLRDEVARLLVHGVLHLLGYDHERSERDALLMARKEKAVLRAIRGKGN